MSTRAGRPAVAACLALLAISGRAYAQCAEGADGGVAEPAAPVPDASLRAMTGSVVRLELEGQEPVEGRLVGFEAQWVTIALSSTEEVVSVPREHLVRLLAVEGAAAPASQLAPAERTRIVGAHFGLTVSLAVDVHWNLFYGFVNGNVLFPLTTLTGNSAWLALALGGGVSVRLVKGYRWFADMFAQVLPLHLGGPYSYIGTGLGFGLRFAAASGFTFAIKLPVVGYSIRTGHSPYGYDPAFRAAYGFGYYYLAGLMGLPLVSVGYRF